MAKREILAGATDQTIDVFVNDSSSTVGAGLTGLVFNSAGLTCYYRKGATGTPTALTLATQTVGGAHSDGGFVAVDGTNCPGQYRLDLSDTIVATAGMVTLYLRGASNMVPCVVEIEVVSVDKFNAVNFGLSLVPANVTQISGDSDAADNAERYFDGTGFAELMLRTTVSTVNSQTSLALVAGPADNDAINSCIAVIRDAVTSTQMCYALISDYVAATKTITLAADPAIFTIAAGDFVEILAAPKQLPNALPQTANGLLTYGSGTGQIAPAAGEVTIADFGSGAVVTLGSQIALKLEQYHVVLNKTTIATLASQTSFTLTAGSADNDAYNDCEIVIEDSATVAQKATAVVDDYVGATKTVTLRTDPAVFTMAVGDIITIRANRSLKPTVDKRTLDVTAAGEAGLDLDNVSGALGTLNFDSGFLTAGLIAADAIGASELAADAVTEIRNAITGGAYALSTDANGMVRVVDGTGAGEINTASGAIVQVDQLGTQAKADVNAEVVDAINVDTYAQPGQGTPPATASIATMHRYIYKGWRNQKTQTSSAFNLFNDDASTIDQKATVSDDGTTFTFGELVTGP